MAINGREWLARQLDAGGLGYRRSDNCFLALDPGTPPSPRIQIYFRAFWKTARPHVRVSPHDVSRHNHFEGETLVCCIVEIAMTVWGIVTLARGEFALTGGKVVRGGAAYLIGAILSATLPVLLGIGVVLGLMIASQNGGRPMAPGEIQEKMGPLAFMDIVIVPIILGIVLAIAYANAEDPQPLSPPGGMQFGPPTNYPPPDPNNPYASPRAPSSPYANPYSDPNQRPPGT